MGLRLGPAGYMLVKKAHRRAVVASADQDQPIFDTIPGYLARFCEAHVSNPRAPKGQPAEHPGVDIPTSQCVPVDKQHQVRCCRKLSLGSVDSGIDMTLDATTGLRTSTDDDMRIGKVTPTLTMGHGHPPAQALAELTTPGAQFVQHMAPVPVLVRQPGDPPLGNQGPMAKRSLTAAQIECR